MYTLQNLEKARSWKGVGKLTIGFGIVLGLGLFFLLSGAEDKHEVAMSWPTAEGEVIHSEIKIRSKVNRVHRRVRALTYDYDHAWSVSYEVDGQPHVCSGKRTYSSDTIAYRKLAERKVGSTALVHYNPEDHGESRLDGKYGEPPALAFALGGLFSMMGVGMLVIAMAFESHIESNLPGSLRDLQDVEQPPASQPYVPRNQKPAPGECDLSQTNLESAKYFKQLQQ